MNEINHVRAVSQSEAQEEFDSYSEQTMEFHEE